MDKNIDARHQSWIDNLTFDRDAWRTRCIVAERHIQRLQEHRVMLVATLAVATLGLVGCFIGSVR